MISIIIPAYNIEKYVERCLNSILQQDYMDFEVIMIDDGSNDKTPEILDAYALKDGRIKVYHKKNEGVSKARNLGLDRAKGEYICFIDGDDFIAPHYFSTIMPYFKDDIDIVEHKHLEVYENQINEDIKTSIVKGVQELDRNQCIEDYYHDIFYTRVIWSKIYRSELWENVRFEAISYTEDTRANFEILQNIRKAVNLDYTGYYYLQRNSSAIHQLNLNKLQEHLSTYELNFNIAINKYQQYKELAAKHYIDNAYVVLKQLVILHKDSEAKELIHKMHAIKNTGEVHELKKSYQLLELPVVFVYLLIKLKNALH